MRPDVAWRNRHARNEMLMVKNPSMKIRMVKAAVMNAQPC